MSIKLNLCSGMDYKEGYTNVDYSSVGSDGGEIKVDQFCDILKGLPYDDDSVEEILFKDALEHFNRHNGLYILKEIYRVLSKDGSLYITVPNAVHHMKKFLAMAKHNPNMDDFFYAHEKGTFNFWKVHDDLAGATHESDGTDGDSHKTFYTDKAIRNILSHCGFTITKFESSNSIRIWAVKG